MKGKNLVLFCAFSFVVLFCGPQQPQRTTSTTVQFPTSTQPTQTSSSTPTTSTTTTTPPTTATTTTPQPISVGFINTKTGGSVSSSDPCLQGALSSTSGVKVFNVILDVQSGTNISNLGLEVYVCNALASPTAQNLNDIKQFLALSKKQSGATLAYLPLDLASDVTTTANEYGFVPNSLAANWNSTQGRYAQAMAIKSAAEEKYQFKCGSAERYIMQRGIFYTGVTGALQMVPSTYQVVIVLRRTFDGVPLDVKKWDKINNFNDEVNITIPCTVFD